MNECPAFDMTCPHCLASGECTLTYPENECETFQAEMEPDRYTLNDLGPNWW